MSQRIVFQLPGEPVAAMTPCECGLTIEEIARKDVPVGVPYWIVDHSVIPLDPDDRAEWELSTAQLGDPSGVGAE